MIQLLVQNSTSKLHFNSTLSPLLNSTYQMGEIWVHKLDLNSTFWIPVFTTHISPKYHPNIIQISPRYQLVKTRVLTQIWHDYCRWKLHFWRAKFEFSSILTRVSVCWDVKGMSTHDFICNSKFSRSIRVIIFAWFFKTYTMIKPSMLFLQFSIVFMTNVKKT